ncbi:MAG: dTMP kinase, partial [Actinobacteria bacterium]|nr:dTMP kinase [Actinomycetota bacterium]
MGNSIPDPLSSSVGIRNSVMAIPAFRKLWNAMAFSSFGDWLGLLATTALAQQLAGGVWLYTATVLIECVTLFWSPAKDATMPNLIPKNKLESANQMTLLASYGSAPFAAITFTLLTLFITGISAAFNLGSNSAVDLALFINALSFLFSAWTIGQMDIPKEHLNKGDLSTSIFASLLDGGKFLSSSKVIRGLIFGLLGAFIAAGAVIGLARTFVGDLAGGDAAYGILFGAVFTGLAIGIALGPKIFSQFSRRRLFGAALCVAGFLLVVLS